MFSLAGAPVDGAEEVQRITKAGVIDGGTFTITYAGETTADIAWDATAAEVQAALEALPNIAPSLGDIVVTGGPIGATALTLTFTRNLGGLNLGQVTADATNLTGAGHGLTPSTVTPGVQGSFRGAVPGDRLEDTTNGNLYFNASAATWLPIWEPVPIARPSVYDRLTVPTGDSGPYDSDAVYQHLGPLVQG